jgi:hypothetical protein
MFELHAAVAEEARRASNQGQLDPIALRDSLLVSSILNKYSLHKMDTEIHIS